jgi:hypothetical protein
MFVKMDCVVAELSATIDWSVTDLYKTESELKIVERRSVILAELKGVDSSGAKPKSPTRLSGSRQIN